MTYLCKLLKVSVFCFGFLFLLILPNPVFIDANGDNGESSEVTYQPLVGIPGLTDADKISMELYINTLYTIAISVAAFLAVVKIILAGLKYMLSEVVTNKEDAKKDIKGALLGLMIVLGAWLILTTINPQLVNLQALQELEALQGLEPIPHPCEGYTRRDQITTADLNENPGWNRCFQNDCTTKGWTVKSCPTGPICALYCQPPASDAPIVIATKTFSGSDMEIGDFFSILVQPILIELNTGDNENNLIVPSGTAGPGELLNTEEARAEALENCRKDGGGGIVTIYALDENNDNELIFGEDLCFRVLDPNYQPNW